MFPGQPQVSHGKVTLPEEKSRVEIIPANARPLVESEYCLHPSLSAEEQVQIKDHYPEVVIVLCLEECNVEAERQMPVP